MLDVIWNSEDSAGVARKLLGAEISRYQRAMLGSGHGYWEWDFTTSKMFWYGAFWRDIGYDEADIQKITSPALLLEFIHPEERDTLRCAVIKTLKHGAVLDLCYRLLTKDGSYVWVRVNARAYRTQDNWADYVAGVNYDISLLKRVEQALRASESHYARAIAGTRDGIWDWNIEKDEVEFSDVCWAHIGFEPGEVQGDGWQRLAKWQERMKPRDVEGFKQMLREHILNQKTLDFEYPIRSKDGSTRWVRARAQATHNEAGKAVRVSGSNMDITELKNTQMALMNAKVDAEKANQAKSDFLSNMSHELRTPLNAILGYVQLLESDNLGPEQTGHLAEIRSAGKHLLHLINEVLDLATIEAGKMSLSMEPVAVSRVLEDCFQLIRPLVATAGLTLHCPPPIETLVFADNIRLKQALINLMSNAIKYNRPQGKVSVSLMQPQEGLVRIVVEDTGVGIPEALRAEVFQPFNRLNAAHTKVEGSGVGLVITQRLIEMMGGSIDFSSKLDTGTAFWLDLPTAMPEQLSETLTAVHRFEQNRQVLRIDSPKRILYIEDNQTNIRVFSKIIDRFEMLEVSVFTEPMVGIYKARTELPDIIILDINLPGMDGFEVLAVLSNDPLTQNIPVVALSANAMPSDIAKGRQAGFVDYLTKPLDINCLINVLNKYLV
ncbi:MAG: PAS domain-containing protein [Cellvibrionaceae bacterium]|nr:PAS domain-containing protein [Cellvibrionaceae bacterium]